MAAAPPAPPPSGPPHAPTPGVQIKGQARLAGQGRPHLTPSDREGQGERAPSRLITCGKPSSCWISSTATERGDLRAACIASWHPTLPMTACSLSACSCPDPDTHADDHDQRRSASQAVSLVLTGWARAAQIILFSRLVPIAESHAGRFTVSGIVRS